jgi:hypothetical protein
MEMKKKEVDDNLKKMKELQSLETMLIESV